jgi:hypothetical protein
MPLDTATSTDEAARIFSDAVIQKLSVEVDVSEDNLDKERPIHAADADSLIAGKLRTWFKKEAGANVSVFDVTRSAKKR